MSAKVCSTRRGSSIHQGWTATPAICRPGSAWAVGAATNGSAAIVATQTERRMEEPPENVSFVGTLVPRPS